MSGAARSRLWRSAVLITASGSILVLGNLPAGAAIRGPQNLTVSCDGTTTKVGVTVDQANNGTYKITQNSTNPTGSSVVWAVDTQGNSLSTRTIGNGSTATWTSVQPSNYSTHVHRYGPSNCNGISFGHGNYNWNYTVTYTN